MRSSLGGDHGEDGECGGMPIGLCSQMWSSIDMRRGTTSSWGRAVCHPRFRFETEDVTEKRATIHRCVNKPVRIASEVRSPR